MTDIFHEVEEEVRRERLERIWKEYGDYIIGGASLVVIGIAAFLLWQRYEVGQQQKASVEFDQAVQLAASDPASAIPKLDELSKTAPSGYALLARFAEADAMLANGQRDKALDIFKSISTDNNPIIGNAARLRSAWAIVDTAPRDTVAGLVQPLDAPDSAWRFMAREIIAYADYRSRDLNAAGKEYQALADDSQTPVTVRERAKAMASLIKAGGISEYGSVPPLKTTTPAPDAAPSP